MLKLDAFMGHSTAEIKATIKSSSFNKHLVVNPGEMTHNSRYYMM
jgi:hypothetical protein